MIRWQEMFVEAVKDSTKATNILEWCVDHLGPEVPVSAYTWYRVVFADGEPGGWTNSWRDTGFSLVHLHVNLVDDLRKNPTSYPELLQRWPLRLVFYSQEAVTEFRLTWQ